MHLGTRSPNKFTANKKRYTICDKSEGLSQLYELSIVESVDLFRPKIHIYVIINFRPQPQQEVKSTVVFYL